MLCRECVKKSSCVSPCKEVEAFINQDHVKLTWRETLVDDVDVIANTETESVWDMAGKNLTPAEKIVEIMIANMPTTRDVGEMVGVSQPYVMKVISKIKLCVIGR